MPDDATLHPLEAAIHGSVFATDDPTLDETRTKINALLRMIGSYYSGHFTKLRNRHEEGRLKDEAAASRATEYAVLSRLAEKVDIDRTEGHRALRAELTDIIEDDPETLFSAARALAGFPSDTSDKEAAEKLLHIAKEVATSVGTTGEAPKPEEEIVMPENDNRIEEVLEHLAFDEAQLPANLHYDTDENGNEIASDGQKNFLRGVYHALRKLGANRIGGETAEMAFIGTASLLVLDGHYDPDDRSFYDQVRTAYTELLEPASTTRDELVAGNDEFETGFQLKWQVLSAVAKVLKPKEATDKLFFGALGAVFRGMVGKYDTRPPGSAGFAPAVRALYADETLASGGGSGGGSGIAFLDLPPLNDPAGTSDQIVPSNIEAVSAIYVVYQCEQVLLFDVVDRIVELFMAGLLPMGGDALARKLDDYYWNGDDRVSKMGRQAQYTRALGAPGGDIGGDVSPNVEFNRSLMHVISSLSEYVRQRSVGSMFERNKGYSMETSGEYVRKAIRDLAANCTLYGYAGAQFSAERLGRQLSSAMEILQLPRIREIYGVNSMWQVIERVAQQEFGQTVNIVKHRTLAEETRAILDIVADKSHVWSLSSARPLFTVEDDVPGDLTRDESDRLFRAAQYFLAVNGVQNDQVYEYSQPIDTPALPSVPGMGGFGASGMPSGGGGDVAGQLKQMLDQGQTPSADQIRSMVGF